MSLRNIAFLFGFGLACLAAGATASYVVVTQPMPSITFLPDCSPSI
jgi:hypothetical protein